MKKHTYHKEQELTTHLIKSAERALVTIFKPNSTGVPTNDHGHRLTPPAGSVLLSAK